MTPASILLMDDDEMMRIILLQYLQRLGHTGEAAASGSEAIGMYRRAMAAGRRYDAVILDLDIRGGMGGLETVGKLHAVDPDVKAIVASGHANHPVMSNIWDHGFVAMLIKPFRLQDLERVLDKVLPTIAS